MPIRKKLSRTTPQQYVDLQRLLEKEWDSPREIGQPLIILEEQEGAPIHIYVIWDKWASISPQTDRSEIIMNALDELTDPVHGKNPERFPDIGRVTVAMGLTTEEAERMGIKPE